MRLFKIRYELKTGRMEERYVVSILLNKGDKIGLLEERNIILEKETVGDKRDRLIFEGKDSKYISWPLYLTLPSVVFNL